MSLPVNQQNGVFTHVYPVTDLGMETVVAASDTTDGTNFSTGVPATVVAIVSLVSGSGTLTLDLNDGTGYASADATLSLSGTSRLVLVADTDITYDDSLAYGDTTISANTLYVAARVATSGGLQINEFALLVLYELTEGEDWFDSVRSSAMAVADTKIGDGKGHVSLDPEAPESDVLL